MLPLPSLNQKMFGQGAFGYSGPHLWNQTPSRIRQSVSTMKLITLFIYQLINLFNVDSSLVQRLDMRALLELFFYYYQSQEPLSEEVLTRQTNMARLKCSVQRFKDQHPPHMQTNLCILHSPNVLMAERMTYLILGVVIVFDQVYQEIKGLSWTQ